MREAFMPWTVQFQEDDESASVTGRRFTGIAATVGTTDDVRDYAFAPGAFDDTLKQAKRGRWPVMLFQHGIGSLLGGNIDDAMPVGAWTAMAVEGTGDAQRMIVSGELADTARGRDLAALLRMQPRPALDGLSIGFRPTRVRTNDKPKDGEKRHTFLSVEISEISLVTMPAVNAARISSVQSAGRPTMRTIERALVRDAGLSRSQAARLMRGGYDAMNATRDAGSGDAIAQALRDNLAILKDLNNVSR